VRRCRMLSKRVRISAVGLFLFVFVRVAGGATPPSDACNLPQDLEREIADKYPGTAVVNLSDLGDDDKRFFQKDHGDACPGLVKVDFYGDGEPASAMLLTKRGAANVPTKLILAHRAGERWRLVLLGTGGPSPYAPAIWSQPPGEYRDVHGRKTIQATHPVIVLCKYESWAIVYAWIDKHVAKVWIAD
jgi:hypothetical protein